MAYRQFQPHASLAPYIDAYWVVTGDSQGVKVDKIFPDGCMDIILNLGTDCSIDNNAFVLRNEGVYLVGTMTRFKETIIECETRVVGIRFKPGAFSYFYKHDAIHELTNLTVEFERRLSPGLEGLTKHPVAYLDQFFLGKLTNPKRSLLSVIADIQHDNGKLDVSALAQRHFTSHRQLERNFKRYVGISPKEFINLVRYQSAIAKIRNNDRGRSLLDIALDCGYYDHAHLTNEIRKYTGIAPSLV